MSAYELTVVYSPNLTDEKQKQAIKDLEVVVKKLGGEITGRDVWGKKQLAYAIRKQLEGLFVIFELSFPGDKVKELDSHLVLEERVIRHLLVKSEIRKQKTETSKKITLKEAVIKKATKKTVKTPKKATKKTIKKTSKK